jgi:hypothetical protein
MAAMGDKSTDLQGAAVAKAAINARYGIKLKEVNLGATKKLPRIYQLLGQVPASHTVHNPKLKDLAYKTVADDAPAYYSADEDAIAIINMDENGAVRSDKLGPDGKPVTVVDFDVTTLHEIGHSVDAKLKYMDKNGSDPKHGAWQGVDFDAVVEAHGKNGFYAHFLGGPGRKAKYNELKELLEHCLKSGKLPDKPKDAHAKFGSLFDDWDHITTHTSVQACLAIVVGNDPWREAVATSAAVGQRVYHEAYPGDWVAYDLASRAGKVSDYQFRHQAEWFAEIYSLYYLGKLAPNHFMAPWFASQTPPKNK